MSKQNTTIGLFTNEKSYNICPQHMGGYPTMLWKWLKKDITYWNTHQIHSTHGSIANNILFAAAMVLYISMCIKWCNDWTRMLNIHNEDEDQDGTDILAPWTQILHWMSYQTVNF
jgi:hypothetical protein